MLQVIPFGLNNVGATYQRLVNYIYKNLIGDSMEVYVDDMLIKNLQVVEHIEHLKRAFEILRRYT